MGYSRDIFFSDGALIAYLALVVCVSLVVFHLFEAPAQAWLRSYTFTASPTNRTACTRSASQRLPQGISARYEKPKPGADPGLCL
jgi:peptidoglycan/LPS O-acetylase OafA/YrhL